MTAREEERLRLHRDLHDGLGPVLASQGLKIAAVSHLLDSEPEGARKLLEYLARQNEATVAEFRRPVYDLRAPELDELGLAGAVREYATGLNVRTEDGTRLRVDVRQADEGFARLPADIEVAAYRIATEALTNVMRHARAHHCTVTLRIDSGRNSSLFLEIADHALGPWKPYAC